MHGKGMGPIVLMAFALGALGLFVGPARAAEESGNAPAPSGAEQKAQTPGAAEQKAEGTKEGAGATATGTEAEKPARAKRAAGLVGKVVSYSPQSKTLVVDIPRGKKVFRLGAEVTAKTKIRAGGKQASAGRLKEGDRVRIQYHRVANGDEATAVDILSGKES